MYRVRRPDGTLTDMVNLTRARDAAQCFAEQDRRQEPLQRARIAPLSPTDLCDCHPRFAGPAYPHRRMAAPGDATRNNARVFVLTRKENTVIFEPNSGTFFEQLRNGGTGSRSEADAALLALTN